MIYLRISFSIMQHLQSQANSYGVGSEKPALIFGQRDSDYQSG
ncbi:hypothetical protein [Limnospira platensis]|nr:hypothetical protein [Arthrospira platensis NCB002]WAK73845.1 hypothetical protein AP9108_35680 [Arthrospira sp. PCC 9108]